MGEESSRKHLLSRHPRRGVTARRLSPQAKHREQAASISEANRYLLQLAHLPRGRVVSDTFRSRVLAHNPLGDPAQRPLIVYLPPDYERAPGRRYPVIFVLAGFAESGPMLQNWQPFQPNLSDQLDLLTAHGLLGKGVIAVLPDCFTRYGGSQYLNSSAVGNYDDYLIQELVPYIDRAYRTLGDGSRGIMGKSSGGYGALTQAIRHPDVWQALACHSGDLLFELCYASDFPIFCNIIGRAGGPESWFRGFEARRKKTDEDMAAIDIFAMAACYSPNPAASPFPFEFPFDLHTCERDPVIWQRWLALDPLFMVERPEVRQALQGLQLLFFDCGSRDEYMLHFGARALSRKLTAYAIQHEYEEFDDTHDNIAYRYDVSLPRLARVLQHQ